MWEEDFPTATKHDYPDEKSASGYFVCANCGHRVKEKHGGTCIGVPVYTSWDSIPDGIATKTSLGRDLGLKLTKGQLPVAAKKRYDRKFNHIGYYPLYSAEEATPKAKPTEQQLKNLEKARYMAEKLTVLCASCKSPIEHGYNDWMVTRKEYLSKPDYYDSYTCRFCDDEKEAVEWAKGVLSDENVIILDTETTDLNGEIIELAIIDVKGNLLFDERIQPEGKMSPDAEAAHGIALDELLDKPLFSYFHPKLKQLIDGKRLITYNYSFDWGLLCASCNRYELEHFEPRYDSACAMEWYAQYYGQWSNRRNSYRWQPLNGPHSASGDCKATLLRIREMASSDDLKEA